MPILVDELARVTQEPGLGVLDTEIILIQSAGMQRYLSRELARRLGVLTGVRFPFPRAFLLEVMEASLGPSPALPAFSREVLSFRLYQKLGGLPDRDTFRELCTYLARNKSPSDRYLVASELAHVFDQYLIYRPKWISAWSRGEAKENPQAELFRQVLADVGTDHFVSRVVRLLREIQDDELRRHLPPRISVFGGPGLPPAFLEILARFARATDVHLFCFSVCKEFLGDGGGAEDEPSEFGEGLHPLLSSMAQVAAEFQLLLERHEYQEVVAEFPVPAPQTLLALLQGDIIENRIRPEEEKLPESFARDGSIQVDSCHSPLREVEVVYERILDALVSDPSLSPEDIVILVPRVEKYAPLVATVFGGRAGDTVRIPFRVADRSALVESPVASAYMKALAALRGRFRARELLDLLQLEVVRVRFGFSTAEVERVLAWVTRAGIRWGVDALDRLAYGLGEEAQNSFQDGIASLLVGYVLPDDAIHESSGCLAHDDVALSDREVLDKFLHFVDMMARYRRELGAGLNPVQELAQQIHFLRRFFLELFPSGIGGASGTEEVLGALGSAHQNALSAGLSEPMDLDLALRIVRDELEKKSSSHLLLSAGLTVCELMPLRTIPFRMVCLLGMDQDGFPRSEPVSSFDLMRERRLLGDRSLRADDRYLFLEAILAAKERLVLSFVGHSIQDNRPKPPSVVLGELLEVLGRLLPPPGLLPVHHPLQPFSPRYFDGKTEGLVSSSSAALAGAQALLSPRDRITPLFSEGFRLDPFSAPTVELGDLIAFLKNPPRGFLRRLGIRIQDEIEVVDDREPLEVGPLTSYSIVEAWIAERLKREASGEEAKEKSKARARALVNLPWGALGRVWLRDAETKVDHLTNQVRPILKAGSAVQPVSVTLENREKSRLLGSVSGVFGDTRVFLTGAKWSAKRKLTFWVEHLCLSLSMEGFQGSVGIGQSSRGKDSRSLEKWELNAASRDDAMDTLSNLVEIFLLGHEKPLRLHPLLSLSIAEQLRARELRMREGKPAPSMRELLERSLPTSSRDHVDLKEWWSLFDPIDPLGIASLADEELEHSELAHLSRRVFGPLVSYVENGAFEEGSP